MSEYQKVFKKIKTESDWKELVIKSKTKNKTVKIPASELSKYLVNEELMEEEVYDQTPEMVALFFLNAHYSEERSDISDPVMFSKANIINGLKYLVDNFDKVYEQAYLPYLSKKSLDEMFKENDKNQNDSL